MTLFKNARESVNSATHYFGALLSIIGGFFMITKGISDGSSSATIATCAIFILSLILLYTASGTYHYVKASDDVILHFRRVDHSMVYVLIAGSYTPVLYALVPSPSSIYYIIAIWTLALIGIILKVKFITMPRWLGTSIYLAMGWFVLLVPNILTALPTGAFLLFLVGGLSYTIGGIIYWTKKPNFFAKLGFHEVFHIFILIGSILHFMFIFLYII